VASSPTGTVTFLFTDIEGSTKLWERHPEAMQRALARHDELLRRAIEERGGYVFKTVGDAFCAAFPAAPDALEAALSAQRTLSAEEWHETGPLKVRMALHTGTAQERDGDYFGPPVNRVARLLSAGHGGQVLLSLATQELVRDTLPEGVDLRDLGERRLKDLFREERVYQLLSADLPQSFPPLKTLDTRLNNLPAQPTPLVGREKELREISAQLRGPEVRLLTLTGPGGTGKTRLGLQVAAELVDEFEDGVFFVALAPVTDPHLVASAISGSLGVVESGDQPLTETLKDYLHAKELLLLLDNFEQVLEAGSLVGELLAASPRLKVVVTSRALLGVYGEHEYPVPPLELPDPKRRLPVETLTQYEAVRLFIQRAQAAKAGFEVTNENAPAVAEICVRLDGLPLAIELAAARAKLLPPMKMLEKLGSRLKLLRGGARDLPERQQTLRGTLEWSHDLLDEEEKTLFRRLSVFAGGFTLEAPQEVCDVEGDLELDVLDGVEALVDKSLLRQAEDTSAEPRFSMLQTIREYASEKLEESGEAEAIGRAHAEFFLALTEEAEPHLRGSEDVEWLERLETEHDNTRAALSWALERAEAELRLRLAGALGWFWDEWGLFSEGRRWLESVLAKDGDQGSTAARAKVLEVLGWLAYRQADLERAVSAAEQGLVLNAEAQIGGDLVAGLRLILGQAAWMRGDHERAKTLHEESLLLYRQEGDKRGIAWALGGLGVVSFDRGDHERGKELVEEAVALSRQQGGADPLAPQLISLGAMYLLEGDYARAVELNEEAAALLRERGNAGGLPFALDNMGWATLARGDHEQAQGLYKESLALSNEHGDKLIASESLEGMACVAAAGGEAERAARLFGAAEALREAVGYKHLPEEKALREPYFAAARSQLNEAAWQQAWKEGRSMTLEEAISYALEENADS
jgi:predicted ATPase/class 3 adenylate cyclase